MGRGFNAMLGLSRIAARSARKSLRKQERQYAREQRQLEKQNIINSNYIEYTEHVEYIESITTLHENISEPIDWNAIKNKPSPTEPTKKNKNEVIARKNYNEYRPSIFDKLFKQVEKKKNKLSENILFAINRDENIYIEEKKAYQETYKDWKSNQELAVKILEGKTDAYKKALDKFDAFEALRKFNCGLSVSFIITNPEIVLEFNSGIVVPSESKSILKSGKISIKGMPKTKYYEICRDFISSSVLYVASQVFTHIPIEELIITAKDKLDDSSRGGEKTTILSVKFDLERFSEIDFDSVTPFEALSYFEHNVIFKKTSGFSAVKKIN